MSTQATNIISLSRQDTGFLKGIAICAMLCHHLYGCPIAGVEPYSGVLAWLGDMGKICVALFLFCSGYGLSAGYKNITVMPDKIRFVRNRFIKFYTNYWFILLLFIPLGVFVFGRTFDIAYAGLKMPKRILFELFAINGGCSYLRTWWFNQIIIVLYLLFPFIFRAIKHLPILTFLCAVLYLLFGDAYTFRIIEFNIWQFPFVVGIYWNIFEEKMQPLSAKCLFCKITFAIVSLTILGIVMAIRTSLSYPDSIRMDALSVIAVALCTISIFKYSSVVMNGGAFVGKHAMNMYMIHSFFNVPILHGCEWLRCGVNFMILLAFCLALSMIIEWMKEHIGVYKLQNYLISL